MVAEKPLPPVGVISQVRCTAPGKPVLVPPVAASVGAVFVSRKLTAVGRVPTAVKLSTVLGLPKAMLLPEGSGEGELVRVILPTTSSPPMITPVLVGMVKVNALVVVRSVVSVKVPLTVTLLPRVTLPPVLVLLIVRLLKGPALLVRVCAMGLPPLAFMFTVLPVKVSVPALFRLPVSDNVRFVIFKVPPRLTCTESACRLLFRVTAAGLCTVIWFVGVRLPVAPALLIKCGPAPANDKVPPLIMPSSVRSLPPVPLSVNVLPVSVNVRPLEMFRL